MIYYKPEKEGERIWLVEDGFVPEFEWKTESVFSQCNGYLGVRAAHPFSVLEEHRGAFLCGVFHRAYPDEVTELVNCPDTTWMELTVAGEKIYPDRTPLKSCVRKLDVKSGELYIHYIFELQDGELLGIETRRFASMEDVHLFAQEVRIHLPQGSEKTIQIKTGINGQQTNSGASHFHEVSARVYDKEHMEIRGKLEDNGVRVLCSGTVREGTLENKGFALERRSIYGTYTIRPDKKGQASFEKLTFYDQEEEGIPTNIRKECAVASQEKGYAQLFENHRRVMQSYWDDVAIEIDGISPEEDGAIQFAQYHILGLTPWHTNECSIAAKGLTGEGYKGHVFWDTELFLFPALLYSYPDEARRLLEFRYKGLEGARKKARDYGFRGAMFPWEAAKSGEEETPLYAALNIHTGKANKVWSGIKEYHVTADIIYAVKQYFEATGDQQFMDQCGYEMVFEAASFWASCARNSEETGRYGICDVIGPDEYTEHVDNNAYTNYMAAFCVKTACRYKESIKKERPEVYWQLNQKLDIEKESGCWKEFLDQVYLPGPGEDGIIPQDDTFLSKPGLPNIMKYKLSQEKQSILKDFSREEVVGMQVLKQADVVMLLNLFPHLFPGEIVKKNVLFYEERTLHDSSLSYCAHAQACAAIGENELAWNFFEKCLVIDINDNPYDSRDGIHAASLGGIWNCLIFGFAGVRYEKGRLYLEPHLPDRWKEMRFKLKLEGEQLQFVVTHESICIKTAQKPEKEILVEAGGNEYPLRKDMTINLK